MLLSIPQQVHSCKISTCNKLFSSFHQQLLKSHKSWQCITVDLKLSPKVHFVVSFTAFRLPSQKNGTDFPSLPFAVNYLSLSTAKVASRVRVVSFKPFYCTPPGSVLWRMSLLPFFYLFINVGLYLVDESKDALMSKWWNTQIHDEKTQFFKCGNDVHA